VSVREKSASLEVVKKPENSISAFSATVVRNRMAM
jgi:hypothetical protein